MIVNIASILLLIAGLVFFAAGTAGLLRLPDVHTRLHALTKADNLGLGFIATGAALQAQDLWTVLKLALIWLLVLAASATVSQLIARTAAPPRPAADAPAER
ncbi:cation:proton antiporter [Phenylobacterium sp.]|uniref:cation:proton antiporter n=1 Tax=Phenylobacterium sp. TaxID=1871053 RepID=UPI002FDAE443